MMQTELELVKALLLICKMISKICDIRKERLNRRDETSPQVRELPRPRAQQVLSSALTIATLVLLKGSGAGYYAVALLEQAVAVLQ